MSLEEAISTSEELEDAKSEPQDSPITECEDGSEGDPTTDVQGDGEAEGEAGDSDSVGTQSAHEPDYQRLVEQDVAALRAEFPELAYLEDVAELNNPLRYAALRDMGLSPAEAYLATSRRVVRDNRSHLQAAYGRRTSAPADTISTRELATAREIFTGLSDTEIRRLYKKVTT